MPGSCGRPSALLAAALLLLPAATAGAQEPDTACLQRRREGVPVETPASAADSALVALHAELRGLARAAGQADPTGVFLFAVDSGGRGPTAKFLYSNVPEDVFTQVRAPLEAYLARRGGRHGELLVLRLHEPAGAQLRRDRAVTCAPRLINVQEVRERFRDLPQRHPDPLAGRRLLDALGEDVTLEVLVSREGLPLDVRLAGGGIDPWAAQGVSDVAWQMLFAPGRTGGWPADVLVVLPLSSVRP